MEGRELSTIAFDPFPQYADLTLPANEPFVGLHGGFQLSQSTTDLLLPREKVDSWKWICENVHTKKGQPFNYIDYPWVEGICNAWDDPAVRELYMMAGSRLGKTETFLALMMCAQRHDPDVGMFGTPTEQFLIETIADRFYPMMDKAHAMRDILPPPHRRNSKTVRTKTFIIHGAWAGSPTTLGDKDPRYLHGFEVDKWTKNASEEADPFELFSERGAEIPDRKFAGESTPTIEGLSRIKKRVKTGTNRLYNVPCPLCEFHQQLVRNTTGDARDGGLWWDRQKDGTTTPAIADRTARYICVECGGEWSEEQRKPPIRRGVWVPYGQMADAQGRLSGDVINAGPVESFSLSRLYGPTFTFGDYARAFARTIGNPEQGQSFANNWDGDTWVRLKVEMTWEQAANKLCVGEWGMGEVPEPVNFLTTTVDVQIDHFVLTTIGWDRLQRGFMVAVDTVPSWSDVKNRCRESFPHMDGGPSLPSFVSLVDSRDGNRKDEILDFCESVNNESGPFVWPSMGARPGTMNLQPFRKMRIDQDKNIGSKVEADVIEGMHLVMINTTFTQEWLDNAIARRKPFDPMSIIFPKCMIDDQDFFEQLLNETYDPEKGTWVRDDKTTIPVDFRDCVRYGRAAAEVHCNGKWSRVRAVRPGSQVTREQRKKQQERKANEGKRGVGGFVRKSSTEGGFLRKRR